MRPMHAARWLGLLLVVSAWPGTGGATSAAPRLGDKDEEVWAIRCITLQMPDHQQRAKAYADALKKVSGLKADLVQVLTDADGTAVFYGRYKREYGPQGATDKFKPNHLTDLETIRGLRFAGADVWPFMLASMDLLPTYRSAHPEWDLEKVDGHWALHVAVFYNTDTFRTRRSAAEEYCALLRKQGEEAYFHHGAVHSSVYVGVYPAEAVSEIRQENPLTGVVQTTLRIVDPKMIAAQQRFPESLQNGHKVYEVARNRDGTVRDRAPSASFPVVIPQAQRRLDKAKAG
ncbi:MAG: hypothetical protein KA383_08930 [Phycisphaerae bacterium]|nr:hypothetical protein [Phycisphaerae bacterium]